MTTQLAIQEDLERKRLRKEGGVWLRERRERAGLSQRELANQINVTYYTFVSQIEAGRGRIPAERYKVWANALQIDPRDFVQSILSFYEPTTHDILFDKTQAV